MTMTYNYKGYEIKKVTRNDYVVFGEAGFLVHERTLKEAKAKLDTLVENN